MSSPCLLRPAPISQPRLRDVRISLKAASKIQDGKDAGGRRYPPEESDAPVRSRSTPPAHRALRRAPRGRAKRQQQEEHHPERNGTVLLQVPLTLPGLTPVSLPPSSCQRPVHPSPSSSSSSSLSGRSMKRARWLSSSASNIYFNSILDGRFRQLQGIARCQGWLGLPPLFPRTHPEGFLPSSLHVLGSEGSSE